MLISLLQGLPFTSHILRERVATNGKIRPMEPSSDITALNWPAEMTCVVTEPCARRYLEGQATWDEKYAKTAKKVKEKRDKHILKAAKDTERLVVEMEKRLKRASTIGGANGHGNGNGSGSEGLGAEDGNVRHPLLNDPLFSWGWALDGENPPPSSLVARRDTAGLYSLFTLV